MIAGMKLLTVVTEGVVEERLLRDLRRLGVRGASRCEVRTSTRSGQQEWEVHHVRIEALLDPQQVPRVMALLEKRYLPHYELQAWSRDVEALTSDR